MIDRLQQTINAQNSLSMPTKVNITTETANQSVSFQSQLNQALQGSNTALQANSSSSQSATTNTQNSSATADILSLLMQNELNSLFQSSFNNGSSSSSGLFSNNSLGSSSSSLLTSALAQVGGTTNLLGAYNSNNTLNSMISSELIPALLSNMGITGGSQGLPQISSQIPLGSVSATLFNQNSTLPLSANASSVSTPADKSMILNWINQYAPQYGLSPKLVNAVVTQESGYSTAATSSAGAIGLMQLMPETAAMLGVKNPYDPLSNLLGGMRYLSQLVKSYHNNLPLALAAYNAGSHAVSQYGGIPPYPETQKYVQDVLALMNS